MLGYKGKKFKKGEVENRGNAKNKLEWDTGSTEEEAGGFKNRWRR